MLNKTTEITEVKADETSIAIGEMRDNNSVMLNNGIVVDQLTVVVNHTNNFLAPTTTGPSSIELKLNDNINKAIDIAKNLIVEYKPVEALLKIENIEKDFVGLITGVAQFRLFSNKGLALILTNEVEKGADLLLAAFDLDSSSDTAHANRIKAYYLKKDRTNFNKAISEVPITHCMSTTIAGCILEAIQTDLSIKEFPNFIKDYHFTSDYMNCLLANRFYSIRGDEAKALEYLEKARALKPNDWQVLGLCGSEMLWQEQKDLNARLLSFMPPEQKERIEKAAELLKKSWDTIKDSELDFSVISHIAINLSSAYRMLNKDTEEKEIVDRLIVKIPDDPEIIIKKVLTSSPLEQTTIEYVEKLNPTTSSDYAVIVAIVYMNAGKFDKALQALAKAPNDGKRDFMQIPIMEIQCYKELKDQKNADDLIKKKHTPAVKNLLKYLFYKKTSDLMKAYNSLGNKDSPYLKLEIAMKLYSERHYREAAILYKKLIKSSSTNDLIYRQYLQCLLQAHLLTDLKTELDKIPEVELDTTLKGIWANYYMQLKDYPKAIRILEALYTEDPNNSSCLSNLFFAYRFAPNPKRTQAILDALPANLNDLKGEFISKWHIILFIKEYTKDLTITIKKAYELVSQNMGEMAAWQGYLGLFFMDYTNAGFPDGKTSFVLREEASNRTKIYIIDDNQNIKSTGYFKVLRSSDAYAKKLLVSNLNDIISLSGDELGAKLKIVQISNNYFGLGCVIRDLIDIEFPNSGIVKLTVKDNNIDEVLEFIKLQTEKQKDDWKNLEGLYNSQGVVYASMLAGMRNHNVISVLCTLERNKFRVALGTDDEKKYASGMAVSSKLFIVDLLTVYNIFVGGVQDIVAELLEGRIYTTQNTKELIKSLIVEDEHNIKKRTGRMIPDPHFDKPIFATFEDLEEIYKTQLSQLKAMLDWLNNKAQLATPSGNNDLDENKKLVLSALQEYDPETAAIVESAIEYDLSLFSDDFKLRQVVKGVFNIDSLWTQGLLMNKSILVDRYAAFIVNSVRRNHTFITFNSQSLEAILLADKSESMHDFYAVAKRLGESSAHSAARVFFEFYNNVVGRFDRVKGDKVISLMIDGFLQGGCHKEIDARLIFLGQISKDDEILTNVLNGWLTGHFLSMPSEKA